jgi:prevent-host-death family protein
MIVSPQIEPITALARDHKAMLRKVQANSPIFLTQHGRSAAVLLSPEHWAFIASRLEELEDKVDVLEAKLEFAQSGEQLEEFDSDEFPTLADLQTPTVPRRKRAVAPAA